MRSVRWSRGRAARDVLLNADGLVEVHSFEHLDVVTGSGVGGGSLIYTNVLEAPDDDFFAAFPPELSAGEVRPYVDRVRALLRPVPLPAPLPDKNLAFERAVIAAGLGTPRYPELAIRFGRSPAERKMAPNAAGVMQSTCTHCGSCVLGCPERAKTTMDLTYVPVALRHGAELRPLCEVVAIGHDRACYQLRYRDHRSGALHQVAAPRVVLAAGSMNTMRLLFQARDRHRTLPQVSRSDAASLRTRICSGWSSAPRRWPTAGKDPRSTPSCASSTRVASGSSSVRSACRWRRSRWPLHCAAGSRAPPA